MSHDDVYALISDLLALPGRYSHETFRAAHQYVETSFKGNDRVALQKVLTVLGALVHDRERNSGQGEGADRSSHDEREIQEVTAILQDPAFLKSKSEMLSFLSNLLGKDVLRATAKDSRDAVTRKALTAFAGLSPVRRTRVFKMLQRRFIQARGSSLKDWSDIISDE